MFWAMLSENKDNAFIQKNKHIKKPGFKQPKLVFKYFFVPIKQRYKQRLKFLKGVKIKCKNNLTHLITNAH